MMRRMRVYVTGGGRGFVGGHVARALREAGHDVHDRWADVRDPDALRRAIDGCDAVCHVAALYSFDRPAAELEAVNVRGTANVIEASRRAGATRIVHTSSCATCGPVAGRPATEEDSPPDWELVVPYKRTKLDAERLALEAGAVCVNPTTPVGEGDAAPTPTGAMVRGVASGRYRVGLRSTGLLRSMRYDATPTVISDRATMARIHGIHDRLFTLTGRVSNLALIFTTS